MTRLFIISTVHSVTKCSGSLLRLNVSDAAYGSIVHW